MLCNRYAFVLKRLLTTKPALFSTIKQPEELKPQYFSQLDIRIGQITQAWNHPDSELLYFQKIKVLTNPDTIFQVGSGLRKYVKLQSMTGKVVVVANIKPRKLAGIESQGMVVCATTADKSSCQLLVPDGEIGQRLFLQGFSQLFPGGSKFQSVLNPKKKVLQKCLQHLRTDEQGYVVWKNWKLRTKNGYLKSQYKNSIVS